MKKSVALVLAISTALTLSGCASSSSETVPEPSESVQETPSFYTVGDSVDDGSGVIITLKSLRSTNEGMLGTSPDNDFFLIAELEFENTSEDEVSISTLMSMNMSGDSGREYPLSLFVEVASSLDATIQPGRKLLGEIAFDVSEDSLYYLTVQPSLFGDTVEFQFGPDQL